jgi:amidase
MGAWAATPTRALSGATPTPGPDRKPIDALTDHDALGLAELVRSGALSPAELVEVVIRRIESLDPILNFMTTRAFERARALTGTISLDSRFAGVPFLMKDMIDVGGIRRTDGSRLFAERVPEKNVAYVDGIEAAGLNILGMTNVPEFAVGATTNNDLFGATHNPWDLAYSTITSSGGSAAAVGAGVVPMAHGTDGAGSCRLPASATGILGMKPSRYRMRSGESDGGHARAKTNQVLSRTVRDSAALFDLTEDKSSRLGPPIGFVEGPAKRRLRVGLVLDTPGLVDVESEVVEAQKDAALLLESLGHHVTEAEYPANAESFCQAYGAFAARKLAGLKPVVETASGRSLLDSGLLSRFVATFVAHAVTLSPEKMTSGLAYLETLPAAFERAFVDHDVLLTPVSPVTGIRLDEAGPDDVYSAERERFTIGRLKFTGPVNFGGNPAMSVPLGHGRVTGLPIGTHIIAAQGNDKLLYELAYELEEARPWKNRWAPYSVRQGPFS